MSPEPMETATYRVFLSSVEAIEKQTRYDMQFLSRHREAEE